MTKLRFFFAYSIIQSGGNMYKEAKISLNPTVRALKKAYKAVGGAKGVGAGVLGTAGVGALGYSRYRRLAKLEQRSKEINTASKALTKQAMSPLGYALGTAGALGVGAMTYKGYRDGKKQRKMQDYMKKNMLHWNDDLALTKQAMSPFEYAMDTANL